MSWQVCAHPMVILQIPVLTAHYSESLSFGRPGQGRSTPPHQMAISQITVKFIFHSYSESSTFGRPGLGRSTPSSKAISQIPALLWELIFGRPSVGRSTPCQMPILQISALTVHISFLLWELIIWQTRSWQIYPPHQMAISQIPALTAPYSKSSTFDRPGLGRSDPPHQMEISLIPVKFIFHSYSESSYLADQVLADLPPVKCQFYRFLLWQFIFHSYSESLSFGRPGLGISTPPPSNSDFTDSCSDSPLLWELNIWQTSSWQM